MMRTFNWLARSSLAFCVARSPVCRFVQLSRRTQSAPATTGLLYRAVVLGEHIPLRVNIKRVQTLQNTQVQHVAVEGRNHTMTAVVHPIANTYHDRISNQFTEGKISKREEEMHSYIRALLQML